MYAEKPCGCNKNERQKLFHEINKVSFAVVEMVEYLDTHPYETEAIQYFNHYSRLRNKLLKEYAEKFAPLTVDTAELSDDSKWKWGLEELPWRGGCA